MLEIDGTGCNPIQTHAWISRAGFFVIPKLDALEQAAVAVELNDVVFASREDPFANA